MVLVAAAFIVSSAVINATNRHTNDIVDILKTAGPVSSGEYTVNFPLTSGIMPSVSNVIFLAIIAICKFFLMAL